MSTSAAHFSVCYQQCSTYIKSNCYQSLVCPILEYTCTVWALHTQKNISAIEAVQRLQLGMPQTTTHVMLVFLIYLHIYNGLH